MAFEERFFTSSDKVTKIRIVGNTPHDAKIVLAVAHGIGEHAGRYEEMMTQLGEIGIAVYAMDFIGHGRSVSDKKAPMYFGEDGWDYLVDDLISFNKLVRGMHPNTPCFMLGFSMGSFVLRTALAERPDEIEANGAIFAGTGRIAAPVAAMVRFLVAQEADKNGGFDVVSDKVNSLAFDNYNKFFEPTKTEFDWLCKNEAALQEYIDDPMAAKYITPGMFSDLLDGMARSSKKSAIRNTKKIPILFMTGKEDPVGEFTKGVAKVYREFKNYNSQVSVRLYPNSRHDIFHDSDKKRVLEDLHFWMTRNAWYGSFELMVFFEETSPGIPGDVYFLRFIDM